MKFSRFFLLALLPVAGACNCGTQLIPQTGILVARTAWFDNGCTLIDNGPITVLDSRTEQVTLINRGRVEIKVEKVVVKSFPDVFVPKLDAPVTIAGGDELTFDVTFTPREERDYADELAITYKGGETPIKICLTGTGDTFGQIAIEPTRLDFGRVGEMQQKVEAVTLESVGNGKLVITSLELVDAPPEITFAGSSQAPVVLDAPDADRPGGRVQIAIRCAPTTNTSGQNLTATLRVGSSDVDPERRSIDVPITCSVNRAPIAKCSFAAGAYGPGQVIPLSGLESHDPDGDNPITYLWGLQSPPGSESSIDDPTAAETSFLADVAGTYVAYLLVSDSTGLSCIPTLKNGIQVCDACTIDVISPDELEFQLSWENDRTDLDIHVIEDGEAYYLGKDCYWGNRFDSLDEPGPVDSRYPDESRYCAQWGTSDPDPLKKHNGDDPTMFTDDLAGYGPETVLVGEGALGMPQEPSAYEVGVVFRKTNGAEPSATRAILRVFVYGKLAAQADQILEVGERWRVFKVSWPDAAQQGKGIELIDEIGEDVQ